MREAARALWSHLVADGWFDDARGAARCHPRERARIEWLRIVPCLPNSYGAAEGWAFQYVVANAGARGAFRAVAWWN